MIDSVKLAIRDYINKTLKIPVIYAEHADPRPSKTYATIRVLNGQIVGQPERTQVDDNGIQKIKHVRYSPLTIQIIGSGAFNLMEILSLDLHSSPTIENLYYEKSISIVNISDVLNLTGLLETDFEERCTMDIVVGYANELEKDVGLIEKIEINGKIIDITED